MDQEENINWDKLLKHLERGKKIDCNTDDLNQEELELLQLANEITMGLQENNPENKFPVASGWNELQAKYIEKENREKGRFSRVKLYKVVAMAALLVVVLAPAWWLFRSQGDTVNVLAKDSNQIQLTLANGETIALEGNHAEVIKSEGATLNESSIVYQKETTLPETASELRMNVLEVPHGKYTRLQLSDGTQVWVNSGSKLSYPTTFPSTRREVSLEGEAYFDVSHIADRPFTVQLKNSKVRVLGTAFSINTFGSVIYTALDRGKVNIETAGQSMNLLPGELGKYNEEGKELSKTMTDLRAYTAWKDADIYFDNARLEDIAFRLEREYNMHFDFENEALKNLHFTIDMPKTEDVIKILNNIKFSSTEVDFTREGSKVKVKQR